MEVLFENTLVRNKATAKEFYGYFSFRQPVMLFFIVLFLVSFTANLVGLILGSTYELTTLIVVPLFFVLVFWRYTRQVNIMLKRDREALGGEVTMRITVTDTYIQSTVDNDPATTGSKVSLTDVKKVVRTKNLILVCTKAKLVFILHKDTFKDRNKDQFLAFMKSKGIKVKG